MQHNIQSALNNRRDSGRSSGSHWNQELWGRNCALLLGACVESRAEEKVPGAAELGDLSNRDVRRGIFPVSKKHRSVFFRCLYEKHRKLRNFIDIVFVRQEQKKEPRSTMALDRQWFFQVTLELQGMPIDNSASILSTQLARLFLRHSGIFVFFAVRTTSPLFLFFFAGLATKCPVKEKCWSRKGGEEGWRRHEYGENDE